MQPEQDNSWSRRMPMAKYQLAKIVVEGQQDAVLVQSCLKDDAVWLGCQSFGRMDNVLALAAQPMHNAGRKILIGQIAFAHADFVIGGKREKRSFLMMSAM